MKRPSSLTELEGKTTEQILGMGKDLNFLVEKRPLAMSSKPEGTPGSILKEQISGYKAIVRNDTHHVFQVAKNGYEPHQNKDIVGFMRDFAEAGGGKMVQVGTFRGGAVVFAMVKLNTPEVVISGGSKLHSYGMIATSHDGSLITQVKPTSVYVVCWNTFLAALREGVARRFRLKHTSEWTSERAREARMVFDAAIEETAATNEKAIKLAKVTGFDEKARIEYVSRLLNGESLLQQALANTEAVVDHGALLDKIVAQEEAKAEKDPLGRIGKQILEAIMQSPGSDMPASKNTLWGAYNGVTFFVDHKRGRGEDTRGYASQFGEGDKLKTRALELAIEMAEKGA